MERVKRTVQNLAVMPLGEMKQAQIQKKTCPIAFITDELFSCTEPLPEEKLGISYLDFIRMIDSVGGDPKFDFADHDSWAEQMLYFRCLAIALIDGSQQSAPMKLFLATPLQAFYTYLRSVAADKKLMNIEFSYIRNNCKYSENYTIKDFLMEKLEQSRSAWQPFMSLPNYKSKMEACHKDMGRLLVSSLCAAFPEKSEAAL